MRIKSANKSKDTILGILDAARADQALMDKLASANNVNDPMAKARGLLMQTQS